MRKRVLFLLAVISVLCSWTSCAFGGGWINSGETVSGAVNPPSADSWTFTAQGGERVRLNAVKTSGNLQPRLYLYPPGGGPAEKDSGALSYLDYQLLHSGTYTLEVRDFSQVNAGSYNLSFLAIPGEVSSAADLDGGPIASGQTLSATINQDSDMDAFQFSAQSGERVRFTAVTTAGTMKPRLFLYPSGGAAAVVNSGALNYLDYQLTDSGAYTLVIEDFNARLNQSGTGGYNLSFLKIPGTVNSAADPDSGPIASGQTLSANIHAPADMDAFQFFGQAGERVRFNGVKTSGSVQPRLFLYPPGGAAAEINSGALNYLDYQLKNTGLYTLVIMDFSALVNQVNTGNYNVTFLKMPGAVNTAGDRDGGLVTAGQTPSGAVDTLSDLDAFQFYGQAGDEVLVTAEKTSGTLAPRLFLCPPGGGPAEADSGVLPSINHQLQTSGLYTIVLQDFSRTNTGSYKLSYSKTPATSGQGIYNPSPANGAAINSVSGILGWDSVPGATAYDLYLGEGVTQALPKIGNNLASPSLAFANLTRGKTYYWQVVAHSAQGEIMGPCNWFIVKNQPTGSSGHILLLLME